MSADSDQLTPARRRLLELLKRQGEATADELAELLGTSASAVRQHLAPLRSAGFVSARQARGNTGRPADIYQCTARSDALFATDLDLAVQILDDINAEHPELIEHVFERRRRRLGDATGIDIADAPLLDRVAAVSDQLDAQGYLSDFEEHDDGTLQISLHNCPISDVAVRYPHACAAELGFIEDLLPDAVVTRTMHRTTGGTTCAYRVAPTRRAAAGRR